MYKTLIKSSTIYLAVTLAFTLSACIVGEEPGPAGPPGRASSGDRSFGSYSPAGWDPGLMIANARPVPDAGYHQFCAGGGCSDARSYEVASSAKCVRGPGHDVAGGKGGLCPSWFNWEWDPSLNRLKAHLISVPAPGDGYQYTGLQHSIARFPSNLNDRGYWPMISSLAAVHVQVRARYCGSAVTGRVPYYIDLSSASRPDFGGQVSIDLLSVRDTPAPHPIPDMVPTAFTEAELLSRTCPSCFVPDAMTRRLQVNGEAWGVFPAFGQSPRLQCYGSIESAPWLDYTIDIQSIMARLAQQGRLNGWPTDLQYSGGTLGGIETWGEGGSWAEVEISDHTLAVQ
jgi:hypothetical protein